MEEALDKMFRESEDEDLFLNLPNELFKPMVGNFGTRQRERQTRFKMSHGQNSRYVLFSDTRRISDGNQIQNETSHNML